MAGNDWYTKTELRDMRIRLRQNHSLTDRDKEVLQSWAAQAIDHSDAALDRVVPAAAAALTPATFQCVQPNELHGVFAVNEAAGETGSLVFSCRPKVNRQDAQRLFHPDSTPRQFYSEVAGSGVVGAGSLSVSTACDMMRKAAYDQGGNALSRVDFAFSVVVEASQQETDHRDTLLANTPRATLPRAAVLDSRGNDASIASHMTDRLPQPDIRPGQASGSGFDRPKRRDRGGNGNHGGRRSPGGLAPFSGVSKPANRKIDKDTARSGKEPVNAHWDGRRTHEHYESGQLMTSGHTDHNALTQRQDGYRSPRPQPSDTLDEHRHRSVSRSDGSRSPDRHGVAWSGQDPNDTLGLYVRDRDSQSPQRRMTSEAPEPESGDIDEEALEEQHNRTAALELEW